MLIYISGKMSGLPKEHYQNRFAQAEQHLNMLGHKTINPASKEYAEEHGLENKTWEECMLIDINELSKCNAIYMLSNYKTSKGAVIEHHFAKGAGKKVLYEAPDAHTEEH